MRVVIIDYGVGNLANVAYAWQRLGVDPIITNAPRLIRQADLIELPGVGAMRDAMENLRKRDLIPVLEEEVKKGTFFLGVGLGMQALFEASHEDGLHKTLGFLPGEVMPLKRTLKVPHMGWNRLDFRQFHWLQEGLPARPYVYFVHSYYKTPTDTPDVIATADYDGPVPAVCCSGNVVGMQFHPEKSGSVGARLLQNMADYVRKE